jgi:glycosidase
MNTLPFGSCLADAYAVGIVVATGIQFCGYRDPHAQEHGNPPVAWERWAIVSEAQWGGTGRGDSGDNYVPAPDIDHSNDYVRESLKGWLRWLDTKIGFAGWRLDFVKVCI